MIESPPLVPFTFQGETYKLKFDLYGNRNGQCIRLIAESRTKVIATITERCRDLDLKENQCIVKTSLPLELDGIIESLVNAKILIPNEETGEPKLHEINLPVLVRVFHNRNSDFKVEGDLDQCRNLQYVGVVTVPSGENPLSWAFSATNHIDSIWTENGGVIAEPGSHRSTSVGDVFEVIRHPQPPDRHIVEGCGFSLV